ncbi:S1C family serine protease [Leifsonia sp. TF02-11]|uniref:S1C family serine protease n=1 Tax=Leifsonia sp. TF02-11 TaxID=2815212 RepID=UPI001AA199FE|nr:trypsin-like peptidase domain-containing protein [Leifsonia sp. TF02-11]MBO1738806.1 trypsin-like peptidase domain-containing protein [Leifsonia sp. TF02-11]
MDTVDGVPTGTNDEGAQPPADARLNAAAQPDRRRHRSRRVIVLSTAVAATAAVGAAFGLAAGGAANAAGASTSTASSASIHAVFGRSSSGYGYGSGGYGYGYGSGSGGSSSSSASSGSSALASATAAQEVGVVDITSQLTYDQAESAGTGLVLTSNGEILTNNHVVEGATSISVTVVATGAQYTATVVGTDATDDIAVLQLGNASGLSTATLDTASDASVGEAVTGVGNAGGTGGTPSASPGTITALDQTITTQAEQTAASETLNGLIETDADIQAGDSGGPLFNSADQVIGIDTAAEQGGAIAGYAIPIEPALTIAGQIESGRSSSTVTIGYPAFLGVEVDSAAGASSGSGDGSAFGGFGSGSSTGDTAGAATSGATIAGVIDGSPAAAAGLTTGDTITAVNGTAIDSASALTAALGAHAPGDSVSVTWTDASGASHTATVTLAQGPAA